jgi:hypothetical protein
LGIFDTFFSKKEVPIPFDTFFSKKEVPIPKNIENDVTQKPDLTILDIFVRSVKKVQFFREKRKTVQKWA